MRTLFFGRYLVIILSACGNSTEQTTDKEEIQNPATEEIQLEIYCFLELDEPNYSEGFTKEHYAEWDEIKS